PPSPAPIASRRPHAVKSSRSSNAARDVIPAGSALPSIQVPAPAPQPTEEAPRTLAPTRASPRIASRNLNIRDPVSRTFSGSAGAGPSSVPYAASGTASRSTVVPVEAPMSPGWRSLFPRYTTRQLDQENTPPPPSSPLAHEYEGDGIDMYDRFAPTSDTREAQDFSQRRLPDLASDLHFAPGPNSRPHEYRPPLDPRYPPEAEQASQTLRGRRWFIQRGVAHASLVPRRRTVCERCLGVPDRLSSSTMANADDEVAREVVGVGHDD
ncbi:hypothetical protein BDK51DRAFT_50009, partial [Blyttiomyces helicus]